MGLGIHYSGRFNPDASLLKMAEEIADIVTVFEWPYHLYKKHFPNNKFDNTYNNEIYGISFTPTDSETISLCFLSNGRMSRGARLMYFGITSENPNEEMLYTLSAKTQFAGIRIHIFIIKPLKYLSKKYFIDFTLSDEGKYWETGDEKLLAKIFSTYNSLATIVSKS